jgi:hypothetical protein
MASMIRSPRGSFGDNISHFVDFHWLVNAHDMTAVTHRHGRSHHRASWPCQLSSRICRRRPLAILAQKADGMSTYVVELPCCKRTAILTTWIQTSRTGMATPSSRVIAGDAILPPGPLGVVTSSLWFPHQSYATLDRMALLPLSTIASCNTSGHTNCELLWNPTPQTANCRVKQNWYESRTNGLANTKWMKVATYVLIYSRALRTGARMCTVKHETNVANPTWPLALTTSELLFLLY